MASPILHFHMNGLTLYVDICNWLLSLSITCSGFIHVVTYISTSFPFPSSLFIFLAILKLNVISVLQMRILKFRKVPFIRS